MRKAAWVGIVALVLGGCGLDVTITGGENAIAGQAVTFQVKLENTSACPLIPDDVTEPDYFFTALVPRAEVEQLELLAIQCGLLEVPPPEPEDALAELTEGDTAMARELFASVAAQAAAPSSCSGPGVTCEPFEEEGLLGVQCSLGGLLAPGEVRELTCTTVAPATSGQYFTIATAMQQAGGVCRAGTPQAGQGCIQDVECGGPPGSCVPGICVGGSNAGNGCELDVDCPDGTCVDCDENEGVGFACVSTAVAGLAPAPALSAWAMVAAVAALGAIGAAMLRRRRVSS